MFGSLQKGTLRKVPVTANFNWQVSAHLTESAHFMATDAAKTAGSFDVNFIAFLKTI
jgi:hypothetical protein